MDANTILVETTFMFGKHAGTCDLTPDAAEMFSRMFDLTVRAALADNPEQWDSREAGRTYALAMMAKIGEEAARQAGSGRDITAEILRQVVNRLLDRERSRLGFPMPQGIQSVFCLHYLLTSLFQPEGE